MFRCSSSSKPFSISQCECTTCRGIPIESVLWLFVVQGLLATEGIAEAFRSLSLAVASPENASRTFYIIAPSNEERNAWVDAIKKNLEMYQVSHSFPLALMLPPLLILLQRSPEALTVACKELKCMLGAVGSEVEEKDLPSVLLLLHQKKNFISQRTMSYCQSHNHLH